MASHISFITSGLVLVIFTIIIIQSAPIEKDKETVQLPSINNNKETDDQHILKFIDLVKTASISTSTPTTTTTTTTTTTVSQSSLKATTQQKTDNKKKRYIDDDDDDDLDGRLENESDELDSSQLPYFKYDNADDNIENKLYAKMKEISPTINNNADKPINTDDSKLFSDIKMSSSQQTDIVRRRRDVKLNNELNIRRKRAASAYDFYDTDSLDEPQVGLIQRYRYIRPTRSFAPLYWYPSVNQRNVREALLPSFYDSLEYPPSYLKRIGSNDIEENSIPIVEDQIEDEDEDDYESNRYPILLPSYDNTWDDEQLQEKYSRDDLPVDEDFEENLNENDEDEDEDSDDEDDDDDDDDEDDNNEFMYQKQRPYNNRYGSIETYF